LPLSLSNPLPPPTFTIGALAIAARRANAIGAVRLTLAPERLEIELLHVAGFAEGFAPGAVADAACFQVPYLAVRGLVHKGRMLYLILDPTVIAPYNRFALVRFSEDPVEVLARAYRARAEARWASYLLPAPIGALVALFAPGSVVSGWLGRGSLGLLVTLALWALFRQIVAFRTWGGPISDRHRDAFEAELSSKLGLMPSAAGAAAPLGALSPEGADPEAAPAQLGRAALAIALAAAFVVGGMAFLQRYAAPGEPPPAVPLLMTGVAAAVARVYPAQSPSDAARGLSRPRCACMRADSPLWKDGVPALSLLMFSGESEGATSIAPVPGPRPGSMQYNFDLAVVNNAARPQRDVRVTVTFARRNKKGRRVGAIDRGLFWEGELAAGRAVKWHVKAPGTEMRVDPSVTGMLEKGGIEPASPDAFFALTSARFRAVRIHAAIMLAYLRDPRAEEAARGLGDSGSPDERRTLARLRRAMDPVFACGITVSGGALEACVFNASSQPRSSLELREIPPGLSSDAAATATSGGAAPLPRRFPIEGAIPVHEGVRLRFPLEGEPPEEWAVTSTSDP
jgi:hypothetical protein